MSLAAVAVSMEGFTFGVKVALMVLVPVVLYGSVLTLFRRITGT